MNDKQLAIVEILIWVLMVAGLLLMIYSLLARIHRSHTKESEDEELEEFIDDVIPQAGTGIKMLDLSNEPRWLGTLPRPVAPVGYDTDPSKADGPRTSLRGKLLAYRFQQVLRGKITTEKFSEEIHKLTGRDESDV